MEDVRIYKNVTTGDSTTLRDVAREWVLNDDEVEVWKNGRRIFVFHSLGFFTEG